MAQFLQLLAVSHQRRQLKQDFHSMVGRHLRYLQVHQLHQLYIHQGLLAFHQN